MENIFIIIAENGVQDEEIIYPYYRLSEIENLQVLIASSTEEIKCKEGVTIKRHVSIEEINSYANKLTGILVPGGFESPEKLRQNEKILKLVNSVKLNEGLITAICHGVWVLISAGIMEKVHSTCYPGMKDDLVNSGANYEDLPAIKDGNIITGRRPRDLSTFMKLIVSALNDQG